MPRLGLSPTPDPVACGPSGHWLHLRVLVQMQTREKARPRRWLFADSHKAWEAFPPLSSHFSKLYSNQSAQSPPAHGRPRVPEASVLANQVVESSQTSLSLWPMGTAVSHLQGTAWVKALGAMPELENCEASDGPGPEATTQPTRYAAPVEGPRLADSWWSASMKSMPIRACT